MQLNSLWACECFCLFGTLALSYILKIFRAENVFGLCKDLSSKDKDVFAWASGKRLTIVCFPPANVD